MSILEDNCNWEDDTEDAEENIYVEKEDTQGEEEEGDEKMKKRQVVVYN